MKITALGLGDELLDQRLDAAGLGLGGSDTAVLDELGGQVAQDEALMGGATTQAGALGRLRPVSILSVWSRAALGMGSQYCSVSA